MKTSISKENILKSSILFFSITAFVLSALVFTSCSESEGLESSSSDEVLISKIETAAKVAVSESVLPSATQSSFNGELADSTPESIQFAEGLGYKVSLYTFNESREEFNSDVYFSLQGRQLEDTNEKRGKKRRKCFEFVFPIDFIMPDNSSITLNSKEDWTLIRDWVKANPDATERPELVFPIDVTLKDGTVQTLLDRDELKAVKEACRKGKDKRKCFRLVLPVSFTMPDATVITVDERKDFREIRRWHKANPDATERGMLNFPVDITYKDGTTATINDADEMKAAKQSCRD